MTRLTTTAASKFRFEDNEMSLTSPCTHPCASVVTSSGCPATAWRCCRAARMPGWQAAQERRSNSATPSQWTPAPAASGAKPPSTRQHPCRTAQALSRMGMPWVGSRWTAVALQWIPFRCRCEGGGAARAASKREVWELGAPPPQLPV